MTLLTESAAPAEPSEQGDAPERVPSSAATAFSGHLVAGRFRLIEPLGRGGMGRVYRSHDELLDRPVAVKLIYDDAVSDRDHRRACAVEARAAARVSHPGVVRILDSGFDDGHLYVVMELAAGKTLGQILQERGALPIVRALGLAAQVADALEEAHRQGVVHCDVKPGNLIVDDYGRVRLVDFGIARVSSSSTGLTDQDIHGSAKYVAPEQVEGAAIDGRTDLYALGVVLFEMLAGCPPFAGSNLASILAQRLVAEPPSVRQLRPAVPAEIDEIVRRAMAREPEQRFQSAGAMRDALKLVRENMQDTDRIALREIGPASSWAMPRTTRIVGAGATALERLGPWLARAVQQLGDRINTAVPAFAPSRPIRWPSLPTAIGLVALLGLLMGMTAAQCGMASMATDDALAVQTVDALARPVDATAETVAAPAPTAPAAPPTLAPTPVPPTAPAEPPTEAAPASAEAAPPVEPTTVTVPAQPVSAPPVRALAAPAAPAPAQDDGQDVAEDVGAQPAVADDAKPHGRGNLTRLDDKTQNPPPPAAKPVAAPPPPKPQAAQPVAKPEAPQPAPKPQGPPPGQMKQQAAPPPPPSRSNGGNSHGAGNGNGGGNGRGRGH